MQYDVAIVGGGPGGSACAIGCAKAGLRVLLLERGIFPREKVCGDCINPSCWPVLDELGVTERILAAPHSRISEIVFHDARRQPISYPLKDSDRGEIAIPRSILDAILLSRARESGVEVREGNTVTALSAGWQISTASEQFEAKILVAADGRNSTVARLLGLLPAAKKDRVGAQTHLPLPVGFGERVQMHFLPDGYCGAASVGGGMMNLCLVSRPPHLPSLKEWAAERFSIPEDQTWRTITPLERKTVHPQQDSLLLIGDAARVVEPFTGEGIYYALASGALAARHITSHDLSGYPAAHARLYRGRMWINQLAKAAVLHPSIASIALGVARIFPGLLQFITSKVVGTHGAEIKMDKDAREMLSCYCVTLFWVIGLPLVILLYHPSADWISRFLEGHRLDRTDLFHAWAAYSFTLSVFCLFYIYPRGKRFAAKLSDRKKKIN